jgi:hypothetical protein
MSEAGRVPVRESVGASLRAVRENLGFVGAVALASAAAMAIITLLSNFAGPLSIFLSAAALFVSAASYGALTETALDGPVAARAKLWGNGMRVLGAMLVVGLFMAIVSLVLLIAIAVMLGPVLTPYAAELERVGQDSDAGMALLLRMLQENPTPFAAATLFFGAVWLMASSRVFLAAPASVARGRIITFETWAWTKGNMLRICAARIMLLGPAYVLVTTLSQLLGVAVGTDVMSPSAFATFAAGNVVGASVFVFANTFVNLAVFSALEASLSAYLYRGLKPADAGLNAPRSTDSGAVG